MQSLHIGCGSLWTERPKNLEGSKSRALKCDPSMQEDAEHKQPEPRSARAAHCVYNCQHLKQHPEYLPQGTWPQNWSAPKLSALIAFIGWPGSIYPSCWTLDGEQRHPTYLQPKRLAGTRGWVSVKPSAMWPNSSAGGNGDFNETALKTSPTLPYLTLHQNKRQHTHCWGAS